MRIGNDSHLSYCTNIHPGDSWQETFLNLKKYLPQVRDEVAPGRKFGIGLRLSNTASVELTQKAQLEAFKQWLADENMYVFTINGFPYGGFHKEKVKDEVHIPDWHTPDRVAYTKRLFDILSVLLPEGMEGSISTSPLSYKRWFDETDDYEIVKDQTCQHVCNVLIHLNEIREEKGCLLHLDMEPEPDGILETSDEFIDFFQQYLMQKGVNYISERSDKSSSEAERIIRDHFQLCYDVCHFAVGYETPEIVVKKMNEAGIKIGKIQVSAALKAQIDTQIKPEVAAKLKQFDEPVYLHQSVCLDQDGHLHRFPDLRMAIEALPPSQFKELRTHFHVPVFTTQFDLLSSTQEDIVQTFEVWKNQPFSNHLEIETYTWDVLPDELKTDVVGSIVREMYWVIKNLQS